MIVYNMRYRGPMEYDKFILNVLQYHNEVNEILNKEFDLANSTSLAVVIDQLNEMYAYYVGRTQSETQLSKVGLSETLYMNLLEYREA